MGDKDNVVGFSHPLACATVLGFFAVAITTKLLTYKNTKKMATNQVNIIF